MFACIASVFKTVLKACSSVCWASWSFMAVWSVCAETMSSL